MTLETALSVAAATVALLAFAFALHGRPVEHRTPKERVVIAILALALVALLVGVAEMNRQHQEESWSKFLKLLPSSPNTATSPGANTVTFSSGNSRNTAASTTGNASDFGETTSTSPSANTATFRGGTSGNTATSPIANTATSPTETSPSGNTSEVAEAHTAKSGKSFIETKPVTSGPPEPSTNTAEFIPRPVTAGAKSAATPGIGADRESGTRATGPTSHPISRDFSTNFVYGASEWSFYRFGSWSDTARWSIVNDHGIAMVLSGGVKWGGGNYVAIVSDIAGGDAVVAADIKVASVFNGGHHSGLIARFRDIDNFYELFLNAPNQSAYLSKWVAGKEVRLAEARIPELALREYVHVELHCIGSRLSGVVAGREVFAVTDSAFAAGTFGLFNAGGVTHYQHFAVSGATG